MKKNNIDAHALKKEWLGKNAIHKYYDIYRDTQTGELIIFRKNGIGGGIHTGKFIN